MCVCVCVYVCEREIYLTGQGHLHKASVRSTVHLQIEQKRRAKVKKKEQKSHHQDSCQAIVVSPTYQENKNKKTKMTALCVLYNTMILSNMKVAALEWNFVVL